jgi:hypothetical protein
MNKRFGLKKIWLRKKDIYKGYLLGRPGETLIVSPPYLLYIRVEELMLKVECD